MHIYSYICTHIITPFFTCTGAGQCSRLRRGVSGHIHVYIYLYVCVYVYIYKRVCVYVNICIYIHIYVYILLRLSSRVQELTSVRGSAGAFKDIYMYIYIYMCVYVYIYISACVYM